MTDVVGLPAREPERYLSRAEIAALMGVSLATVDRMVAEGCPSETWGRRVRRFRASTVLAWLRSSRGGRKVDGPIQKRPGDARASRGRQQEGRS